MYSERWIPTWFFLSCKYSLWWSTWDVSDGLFCKFFACSAKYELMKIKLIRSLFISLSLELVVLKLLFYYCHFLIFVWGPPLLLVVSQSTLCFVFWVGGLWFLRCELTSTGAPSLWGYQGWLEGLTCIGMGFKSIYCWLSVGTICQVVRYFSSQQQ